ncbi:S-adenosyl-L-methionine-dependent methyltransferase [Desarmillaria tabescens]|uniref:Arsenite methyltransferase n=1 Tax=Armillaria tabescens TaxID=1929756 RepID=A0AA39NP37_ARMTA|nr:S-adenosyl-L-methionine-dependent methyltransferase [Desarmillaria tabescens]KAK0469237.1 S-adenosyl-L-methionine-dependent methyltransferase [Desarmillaria tabescens]
METANIYRAVEEHYSSRASAASEFSQTEAIVDSDRVASAFGYTTEELSTIPVTSNLGLSCGNPVATANLKEGETFLDLGSGGGLDVFLAAKRVGPAGKCIGIDMNDKMLELARTNATKGGYTNVQFVKGLIHDLPLAPQSVDIISSNCVLNLVPETDKPAVFLEITRVLKPGGRLAISDILLKKPLPEDLLSDVSLYVGCISGASTPKQYLEWMASAGLSDMTIVDTKKDLNVYKLNRSNQEKPRACCVGSESSGCGLKPSDSKPTPSIRDLDLNHYAASYQIYAVKNK